MLSPKKRAQLLREAISRMKVVKRPPKPFLYIDQSKVETIAEQLETTPEELRKKTTIII